MSDESINLEGVEAGDFDPIPVGEYAARVTDGQIQEAGPNAKHPGSEYINWEFTIQEGDYEGRKQWTNTTLLPHALYGLKELLKATEDHHGLDHEGQIKKYEIIDKVIGAPCTLRVTKDTYDGETVNRVKRVKKPKASGGGEGTGGKSSMMPTG